MSDLDDRLRALDCFFDMRESDKPGNIEEIKQAFIDAGWRDAAEVIVLVDTEFEKHTIAYELNNNKMTGQEWYERFYKELNTYDPELYSQVEHGYTTHTIDEAARKASSI